jgi:plasmid maintenance system antidote protein VapI
VINRIVNCQTSVSDAMALKLGTTFRTSPEHWLGAQKAVDLNRAESIATVFLLQISRRAESFDPVTSWASTGVHGRN